MNGNLNTASFYIGFGRWHAGGRQNGSPRCAAVEVLGVLAPIAADEREIPSLQDRCWCAVGRRGSFFKSPSVPRAPTGLLAALGGRGHCGGIVGALWGHCGGIVGALWGHCGGISARLGLHPDVSPLRHVPAHRLKKHRPPSFWCLATTEPTPATDIRTFFCLDHSGSSITRS
jgi:hypothetical protein